MSVPIELLDSPLAESAKRLQDAEQAARAARQAALTATSAIARAEKADARAAGLAIADGKTPPKPTAPAAVAASTAATATAAGLTESYRVLSARLADALTGAPGREWRNQLAAQAAEAASRLHGHLAATADATAEVVAHRRTLEWLDRTIATYPATERFPSRGVPASTIAIGSTSVDVLRLLEAIAAWASAEPETAG